MIPILIFAAMLVAACLAFIACFFLPVLATTIIGTVLAMMLKLHITKFKGMEDLPIVEPLCCIVWAAVIIQILRVLVLGLPPY